MKEHFLEMLNQIHCDLEAIWPNGREADCCGADGNHYRLCGFRRPVSIGRVEARLLYNLTRRSRARRAFEVGTAFGYSSFWIGAAVRENRVNDGWVGSIDNHSEDSAGENAFSFARSKAEQLGLSDIIQYYIGNSPQDLDAILVEPIDIAFIDGNHHGEQPKSDYEGLRPYLTNSSFLIWHDVQAQYGVASGISAAIADGWCPVVFPTSCRICVCYRGQDQWKTLLTSYLAAEKLELL